MDLLRVRIDPTLPDPVWLDVGNRGGRSVPIFSSAFRLVVDDPPRIVSRSGIILSDGEVVDGDHPKPGMAVCTEGQVVAFQQLGGT